MSYIVEFKNGESEYYLAPWIGDPGRTHCKQFAKEFRTKVGANLARRKAIKDNFIKYKDDYSIGKVILRNS